MGVTYEEADRRRRAAELASAATTKAAERLLETLDKPPGWVVGQRRNDLEADLERVRRRTKRNRIVRETGSRMTRNV